MLRRLFFLPLFVVLMGISAVSMYLPAAHAAVTGDYPIMRVFFHTANLFLILTAFIAIATSNYVIRNRARSDLLATLSAFVLLPLILAVPFNIAVPDTGYLNSYVEMVSDFTTTGATLFEDPTRLADSVHLWRALVGWMGGLLMLVTAVAILAPMNLGGYEVISASDPDLTSGPGQHSFTSAEMGHRLRRYGARIFPIYAFLTLVLWIALLAFGDRPFVAFVHATSVLSTSGISPVGGLQNASSGFAGEAIIFLFLIIALSRQTITAERTGNLVQRLRIDPEIRIGIAAVTLVASFLFLRHWVGAFQVDAIDNVPGATAAFWGSMLTVLSFLTTTGFESAAWQDARAWSGLATPGIILAGLALVGGGVATTAGGVKLLRVYALYKHGTREMDRLVHPSSLGGSGTTGRRFRREGAQVAWIFFMMFALSLASVTIALALTGLDFESAVIFAVAALSTTGPLANVAAEAPLYYSALGDFGKAILVVAMVLGRWEALAIVALLNPEYWRS